ncbi:FG-GAP repeat domain-containing protein [Nocardia crassostreae]|uniref:FG-GAP repeat domain-containing protein n=1 Tax=Nocardia crassostreae TaxID=53428 RepID=UPI0009FF83C5|nr:VCBS repeat-containing protein [Nocardia crassostreae]
MRTQVLACAVVVVAAFGGGQAAALPTGSAGGAGTRFSDPVYFDCGTVPWLVRAGDVNRDGKADLVTANAGSATVNGTTVAGLKGVSVLLNTTESGSAAASFAPASHHAAGIGTLAVDLADLDADGAPEVIAANFGDIGPNGVSILRNLTPAGAPVADFAAPVNLPTGALPALVRAVDVNTDGRPDIVTGDGGIPFGLGITVLLNTTEAGGPITFTAPTQFLGGMVAEGLAVGDVNGDGRDDALVSNTGSSNIAVLVNTTAPGSLVPTFSTVQEWVITSTDVQLADLDADGRLDLVAARTMGGFTVRLNRTAPGAFTPEFGEDVGGDLLGEITRANGTLGMVTEGVAVADFTGDGLPDIAANNDFPLPGFSVAVFANHTRPGASTVSLTGPDGYNGSGWLTGTNAIVSADFNADGKPDLATGNVPSLTVDGNALVHGGIAVLMNTL